MKRTLTTVKAIIVAVILLNSTLILAQSKYSFVRFDKINSSFNENQALPAERFISFSGDVDNNIHIVEMDLLSANNKNRQHPLYKSSWRCVKGCTDQFAIPLNYKLKDETEYDFVLRYYRLMNNEEKEQLYNDLVRLTNAYVLQAFNMSKKRISLIKSSKESLNDLNNILIEQTANYRSYIDEPNARFSNLVLMKLEQIDNTKIKRLKKIFKKKIKVNEEQIKLRNQLLEELSYLISTELETKLRTLDYTLDDVRFVNNYQTEKIKSTLKLQAGYAGVALNNNLSNLNYGSAPFVGIAIPFGRSSYKNNFFARTSLSTGIMLQNIKTDNYTYSGPFIGIPFYTSLNYSLLPYLNLQVGTAYLKNNTTKNLSIAPFVGFGLKFNLGLGN